MCARNEANASSDEPSNCYRPLGFLLKSSKSSDEIISSRSCVRGRLRLRLR